ncbi:MAG: ribosomal-processing cysteine protease Prp [Salinispira sp.]
MIHCVITESSGVLRRLESKGHAHTDSRQGAVSISCAAVSALIRSLGMALEMRSDVEVRVHTLSPGNVCFHIVSSAPESQGWLRGLTDMFIQGMEGAKNDFPDQIFFERKKSI